MLRAAAILAAVALAAASWVPVGKPLEHKTVVAADIDFVDGTTVPMVAYGYDASEADTTILFMRWNASTGAWDEIASHTPQFGQPYDDFAFRERHGVLYLGLRIAESFVLSSILRGGPGYDGFDGCWAFPGWTWDFEVADDGNARLVTSPANSTVQLSTYNHTGWDSYPARDEWSPFVNATKPVSPPTLNEIRVARAGFTDLAAVYTAEGKTRVLRTTLNQSSAVAVLGEFDDASAPDVAWAPASSSGLLCVAFVSEGCVHAQCSLHRAAWTDLGCAVKGVSAAAGAHVAISAAAGGGGLTVVAAGISASDPSTVVTASAAFPSGSWAPGSISLPAAATSVGLKTAEWWEAPSSSPPRPAHVVVTYGGPSDTDGVAVFRLDQ